jgi:uncharacterized OB-fold protein
MSVPRFWRDFKQRYNLIAMKCNNCGNIYFPQRTVCPICHRDSIGKMEEVQLSGKGKVYSYSIIHTGQDAFKYQSPYVIAIIELEEGPRITGQIVDCDPEIVEIGMPVKSVFRRIREQSKEGVIHYGFKFVPA